MRGESWNSDWKVLPSGSAPSSPQRQHSCFGLCSIKRKCTFTFRRRSCSEGTNIFKSRSIKPETSCMATYYTRWTMTRHEPLHCWLSARSQKWKRLMRTNPEQRVCSRLQMLFWCRPGLQLCRRWWWWCPDLSMKHCCSHESAPPKRIQHRPLKAPRPPL